MPRPRSKKSVHLEVTGRAPLPLAIEEWERSLIAPVLARLFDAPRPSTNGDKEVRAREAR